MKRLTCAIGLLAAAVLFAGCIVESANPLYVAGDPPDIPELLGPWQNDEGSTFRFSSTNDANKPGMWLTVTDTAGQTSRIDCRACAINDAAFLDCIMPAPPTDDPSAQTETATSHLLLKVSWPGNSGTVTLSGLDPDKLYAYLTQHPVELLYEATVEDGALKEMKVTASTEELRTFLSHHLTDDLYIEPIVLHRKVAQPDFTDSEPGIGGTG